MTLAVNDTRALAITDSIQELEARFALALRRRQLLADYISKHLKEDKHFYIVKRGSMDSEQEPRTKQKPSLTKDGAEMICQPHELKPKYFWEGGPKEPPPDGDPYQITILCRLMRHESFEGEGLGSASSHITTRAGERIPRQRDIGLRHNSTIKMAQKSAYIAATLSATAASEFFTQDMEDTASEDTNRPDKNSHWCTVHNTNWFKRGRMNNYAHPIGDTKEWCNEPSQQPSSVTDTADGTRFCKEHDTRLGKHPTLGMVHKLANGEWCHGIEPEPASNQDSPETFEDTPLGQLKHDVFEAEMKWVDFEAKVLHMSWPEWVRLNGTVDKARQTWKAWTDQQTIKD